jgi:membrane peptidoglycan carboxypeptidase
MAAELITHNMCRLKKIPSIKARIAESRARFNAERRKKDRWTIALFVSYVKQFLDKNYNMSDEYLNKGGLQIYTTLDPRHAENCGASVQRQLDRLPGGSKLQAALVCVDPWTGHVMAMVGGEIITIPRMVANGTVLCRASAARIDL